MKVLEFDANLLVPVVFRISFRMTKDFIDQQIA